MNSLLFLWSIGLFFFGALSPADVSFTVNTTLTNDLRLTSATRALFDASLVVDGAGFCCQFPVTESSVIKISRNCEVLFKNVFFKDFLGSHVDLSELGSSIVLGDGSVVQVLRSDKLQSKLRFSGSCHLVGSGGSLDLAEGSIVCEGGSVLTISNLDLVNVRTESLVCRTSSSTIKLENVNLHIPVEWEHARGSLIFSRRVSIADGIFKYTSSSPSWVCSASRLIFENNMTFSYYPEAAVSGAVASQNNLKFEDASSWLVLNGATFDLSVVGMQLLKGSLEVVGNNYLTAKEVGVESGMVFGDGIFPENDFRVKKFNSHFAKILINKGCLSYRNLEEL